MPRAFLSYSSKQKWYIEQVAEKLSKNITCDYLSFEYGGKTLEEILIELKASDLFVIFFSNDALNSDWVKSEIISAKELLGKES